MLVINDKRIPYTDWVREGRLEDIPGWGVGWWEPSERGAVKRARVVNSLCGHWTAGEAGTKTFEDDGPRVVNVIKNRKSRRTGRPLKAAVSFVIGACNPEDEYAPVWQTMDIGKAAGVHVGHRSIYSSSIGVEIVSCGNGLRFNSRNRPVDKNRLVAGHRIDCAEFYPGQINSWNRLANLLTLGTLLALDEREAASKALSEAGIYIPRFVPANPDLTPLRRRMTRREMQRWKGVFEHFHMWNTTKVDAGGFCVDACFEMGYLPVDVTTLK